MAIFASLDGPFFALFFLILGYLAEVASDQLSNVLEKM